LLTAYPLLPAAADDTGDKAAPPNIAAENPAPLIRHTPSGQMYLIPAPTESDKTVSGSIEIGAWATRGDIDNAKFREYQDPRGGPAINGFDLSVEH